MRQEDIYFLCQSLRDAKLTNPPFLFDLLSLNRMPTLFKELSVSPTSSKKGGASRGNFSPDVLDLDDEASPLMDQQLSRADRLRSSFSEVVQEVTSRDKRDKAVMKVSLLLLAVVLASDLALLLAGCQEVPHGGAP